MGFIYVTVLKIARPDDAGLQNAVYNGHKMKHALKSQALTTADGIFYHVYGSMEGLRHYWTLYVKSGLDTELDSVLDVYGYQYFLYGDSGYNYRPLLEMPFL